MTAERHLIIQDLTLRPSGEWKPETRGWTVVRVAEGVGYCLQGSVARELNVGDTVITGPVTAAVIRASQLGILKLEYFVVLPQYLNGLLTVAECRQLEDVSQQTVPRLLHFKAAENSSQKFMRLAGQAQRDNLSTRSALLQLWASSIASLLPAPSAVAVGGELRQRFREFVGRMAEAELAAHSLTELAAELHCSERHFSRLFREEFKISLRARQVELRLQRARQLLTASSAKIINIAHESGFRHLGLFNAMFKRRFGLTPSAWRLQNVSENDPRKSAGGRVTLPLILYLFQLFLAPVSYAQTTNAANTNAAPRGFSVKKYLVTGNSILPPEKIGSILTNTPTAFGTNVTFNDIRTALGDLQMAYRERGFVTVSVGLPPQKLTNEVVKIKVTEGRLAAINVKGNNHYSTENVLSALPSLHTNMLLNSHVFQRELDLANQNRDRQVYPVIGPGLEPGTSELTLKVKDRFPLHARVEINNQATPKTPDSRVAFSSQYGNLWNLEHQVGVQYTFTPLNFSTTKNFYFSQIDSPAIVNYSAYYRMPLGRPVSIQDRIDASKGQFGYNEVTRQFQMPPPSGRPELTVYTSRSRNDTDVQLGEAKTVVSSPPSLSIISQDAGQNLTLNEGIGAKLALPLPAVGRLTSTLLLGLDFKRYQAVSFNTNNFYYESSYVNGSGQTVTNKSTVSSPQPARYTAADYFPVNLGLNGSVPDSWGQTFFNVQANFNLGVLTSSARSGTNVIADQSFSQLAYTTNAQNNYLTLQGGVSREQRLYKDWTMLLRADGQWANGPLFSNEQYGMGGVAGVRGYTDGAAYGDTGWRVAIEPRTPLVNVGMVDGNVPMWMRASVFMDYGEIYTLQKITGVPDAGSYWGCGCSLTANIGSSFDARLTVAWPLTGHEGVADGMHFYFGAGAQF